MRPALAIAVVCLLVTACGSNSSTGSSPVAPSPSPSPSPAPAPAAAQLSLSASPATLFLSGSSVTITARVTDTSGAPLSGRSVQLSSSAGTLSATAPVTDASGNATVTLSGNAAATVTASTTGANTSLGVPAVAPFSIALDAKYQNIRPGSTDDLTVTVTPANSSAPAPATVSIACGNGQTISLGGQRTGTCTYPDKGTNIATATASTSSGWSATAQTRIVVEPDPVSITLTYHEVDHDVFGIEIAFVANGAPDRSVCDWDFGEGTKRTGACNQNYVYTMGDVDTDGKVTVKVTVKPSTGADPVSTEVTLTLKF